ncbi:hypothetical protein BV25DRAFT_842250 [Artomyces pyxidatus]|uniref:Uncharacterized protein n=1 Tax=Artomyces pyxidatus TaxID=48021 RepID=A0ACB8TGS4_9AGAM|nr:hypothetical protein BV25DRAFT_842250 [Artomyces pyxidatus]
MPSTTPTPLTITRHNKYYIPTADTIFQVENYLFRAHSYFFYRESEHFRQLLSHPTTPGGRDAPGTTDSNPIVLNDIDAASFACFLWVFYNPKHSIYSDATVEHWSRILDLANKWGFAEVRSLAVRELEQLPMGPVEKIEFYQKYSLDPNFLVDAFAALTLRDDSISFDEGKKIGLQTTIQIAKAREVSRGQELSDGSRSPSPVKVRGNDLESLIHHVFGLPRLQTQGTGAQGPLTAPVLSDPMNRLSGLGGGHAHRSAHA